MKRKLYKGIFFCVILYVVDIVACNFPALNNLYRKGFISETQWNEEILLGSYNNTLNYIVGMVVFFLLMDYLLEKKRIEHMIRFQKRENYYWYNIKKIFFVSFIFTAIHEIIGIAFILIYGNLTIMVKHQFVEGLILQIITSTLFYFRMYLIVYILKTKWNKSFAEIMVIAVIFIESYVSQLPGCKVWFPIREQPIMNLLCSSTNSLVECMMFVVRNICMVVIVYYIGTFAVNREDVLQDEKR